MKWICVLFTCLWSNMINAKVNTDSVVVEKFKNRITLQINLYPSLDITHQTGSYILESSAIAGFQIGYSKLFQFNKCFGILPEVTTGISPYLTKFSIPENQSIAIGFREYTYRAGIRDFWYMQLSVSGTYHINLTNNQAIFFTAGIGVRRDRDLVYTNSAGYRYDFTSPRVTVFSLRYETSDEHRNMLTIPIGVYWEKPFAKRLFLSAGLRFTWLTRDWATGNYVFFPGYAEESRGTVNTGNHYIGLDLGFSWSKKNKLNR
jgi:hypothetical protein